ncbi:AraC family transcriptional regulator [Cellulomonas chitinilytica]|uniref:AraC family transcriptional regulator n=1 Tax=Cellulomonas chitinilytica TaxID=398759 RepID=A0A919U4Q2_9CELL|nr:AraC family transcriptional regulator [Cellulomonas chitinilytica]
MPDVDSTVRWHEHDYPHPLARWHTHPEVEIHLIRAGTGVVLVGDHVSTFSAGQLVVVGSGVPHDWMSDLAPGEVVVGRDVVLQVHPDRMSRLAEVAPEAAEGVRLFEAARRGLELTGRSAVDGAAELEAVGRTTGLERLQHVFALLALLSRAPADERRVLASGLYAPRTDVAGQDAVESVLRYIVDNLTQEVRMTTAADLVGMSPTAFSRFFQRAAGRGFTSMVRRMRVVRACTLLTETTMPVVDVCYASGYTNLSNFNRQFRAETGTTPTTFRRTARTAPPARHPA